MDACSESGPIRIDLDRQMAHSTTREARTMPIDAADRGRDALRDDRLERRGIAVEAEDVHAAAFADVLLPRAVGLGHVALANAGRAVAVAGEDLGDRFELLRQLERGPGAFVGIDAVLIGRRRRHQA